MNKSLDNNSNFRRFKKGENLLIGGLSEISKLIANQNNYFKVEKLKEQFLCGDEIVFDDINDFDPKGYHEMVLHTIYLTFEEYEHGFYKKKLSGGINFFTPDKKGAFIEYIYNSDLDEIDKESVISNLNKFKIEFYASEEIRLLYEDISDLMQFIPFIQDISIEKELRLTKLRECYLKLNSAIERNNEVLNSNTSKKHQELCVGLINDKLGSFKQSIDKDLLDYLSSADLLNEKKIILEKNKYPKIFNSDLGYNLFLRLLNNYKKENIFLSNFSFIYYAMRNDNFIHSSHKNYISFLSSEFDIHIDKVDSRQSGSNSRCNLYAVLKEGLKI